MSIWVAQLTINNIASDVAEIIKVGAEIGLTLNVSKCELIAHNDVVVSDAVLQSFNRVKIEDATLLGAPLFPGPALEKAWDKRCEDLARAVDRLSAINSQDPLILLRSSFSAPKVLHLLRCCPSVGHNSLAKFDALLRRSIQLITNSDISDIQWIQASLPVKDGGLPVRRVSSLALPAFLASAASTLSLQVDNLAESPNSDEFLQTYLSDWSTKFGDIPDVVPAKQPFWDRPGVLEDKALVEATVHTAHHQAPFLAASSQHRLAVCSAYCLMWAQVR